ncbi:MAG TPA: hydroxymethylglutaryl-CoA lyase, partial [Thermomicrobiales bacterium]|nr:hydroxymethylglutaryl-CoA lyase [Thermomicrobiales bacterium]
RGLRMEPDSRPVATIVEVGPRDGLQNEAVAVPLAEKIAFVDALTTAGLPVVEATSFVNPKMVPQLADAADLMRRIDRRPGVRYLALVPNERGYDRAREAGVDAIALFTAATDAFAQANVGTTIDGTFARFAPVAARARADGVWIRGYISVAVHCPYTGAVPAAAVPPLVERLLELGCAEICLADTIGRAHPDEVARLLAAVAPACPVDRLALHFHDTTGNAIANFDAGLAAGVRVFDGSVAGLGGCPFAPGAPGNLATETLVAHLESRGYRTGVDLAALQAAAAPIVSRLRGAPA